QPPRDRDRLERARRGQRVAWPVEDQRPSADARPRPPLRAARIQGRARRALGLGADPVGRGDSAPPHETQRPVPAQPPDRPTLSPGRTSALLTVWQTTPAPYPLRPRAT